jgi:hypothetical protein
MLPRISKLFVLVHNAGILQQANTFNAISTYQFPLRYNRFCFSNLSLLYFYLSVVDCWLSGVPFGGSCLLMVVEFLLSSAVLEFSNNLWGLGTE